MATAILATSGLFPPTSQVTLTCQYSQDPDEKQWSNNCSWAARLCIEHYAKLKAP